MSKLQDWGHIGNSTSFCSGTSLQTVMQYPSYMMFINMPKHQKMQLLMYLKQVSLFLTTFTFNPLTIYIQQKVPPLEYYSLLHLSFYIYKCLVLLSLFRIFFTVKFYCDPLLIYYQLIILLVYVHEIPFFRLIDYTLC